jgi:hypothetical protein
MIHRNLLDVQAIFDHPRNSTVKVVKRAAVGLVQSLKKPCGGTFSRLTSEIEFPLHLLQLRDLGHPSLRRSAMQGFEEDCTGPTAARY